MHGSRNVRRARGSWMSRLCKVIDQLGEVFCGVTQMFCL